MKFNFLNIEKPCDEDFSKMKPSASGRFCELCEKNVVDFTQLNALEIAKIMQNSNGKVCARMTQSQLENPINLNIQKNPKNSFSNIAAGLLVASTLAGQPAMAGNSVVNTECSTPSKDTSTSDNPDRQAENLNSEEFLTFRGSVVLDEYGLPLKNAEVSFVTLYKIFTTTTSGKGEFSMKIPKHLINEQYVVSVSFKNVANVDTAELVTKNLVLKESDLQNYKIIANSKIINQVPRKIPETTMTSHRIGITSPAPALVMIDGRVDSTSKLQKLTADEVETVLIFRDDAAVALTGERGRNGLILIITKHP